MLSTNPIADVTLSEWKLKQNMFQNSRDYRQLNNRMLILQGEKLHKLKQIHNQLEHHKKIVHVKIAKKKHSKMQPQQTTFCQQNKSTFIHTSRSNLSTSAMHESKHRLFREVKMQREVNQRYIEEEQIHELSMKRKKRNRVRLIEIESKENITQYWSSRIKQFHNERKREIQKKLKEHEENMVRLMHLERQEATALEDLKNAEKMKAELARAIKEEQSLDSETLSKLYSEQ